MSEHLGWRDRWPARPKTSVMAFLVGLLFAVGIFHLLQYFPALDTDEAFISAHGVNLLSGQGGRYALYDDIFAPSVYAYRDAFAQILEKATNAWAGLWTKAFPGAGWHSRLASWSAGLLTLFIFYQLGTRLNSPRLGCVLVLLLVSDPVFATACCIMRPETLLLFTSGLTLWLIVRLPTNFRWKAPLIGALSGLQVAVHPNALGLAFGFFAFYLSYHRSAKVWLQLAALGAGWAAGLWVVVMSSDLTLLRLMRQTFVFQMTQPPLLSSAWPARALVHSAVDKLFQARTYYFTGPHAGAWIRALQWRVAALTLGLVTSLFYVFRKTPQSSMETARLRDLLWGWVGTFLGMTALVSSSEVLYRTNFYPFLVPLVGLALVTPIPAAIPAVLGKIIRCVMVLLLLISPPFFIYFLRRYTASGPTMADVQRQFHTLIPERSFKIAGPAIFWYDCAPGHFRDIGALTYSRWYTGGQRDVGLWLKPWRPDILIIDHTFKRLFLGPRPQGPSLAHLLHKPVRYRGTIDTGSLSYGTMDIYEIRWSFHE